MRALGAFACAVAGVLALAAAAAAAPPAELPPLAPAGDDALAAALADGSISEAEYALERARSLFQLGRVRREFGDVERPDGREATLLLRDLAARLPSLDGPDRKLARSILARPDDGDVPFGGGWDPAPFDPRRECSGLYDVCVHWVNDLGHPDAPDLERDDDGNSLPDYVDLVLLTLDEVWAAEIDGIGYRQPLSDDHLGNNGGDGRLDVYLDDLGADGIFGYCTTDAETDVFDFAVPVYCVLDNDFVDFGLGQTPEDYLRVTAAHEFFHAVQAAYDFLEDYWLLEGTATNMEETVYFGIDDNVNFLTQMPSPLSRPNLPLDRGGKDGSEYGSWIFWRFLEEKVAGGDPAIVREIWERADAGPDAAFDDQYSLQAVRTELAQRGLPFADAFARFGRANRLRDYADGALYPAPPRTKIWGLGRGSRSTRWRSWRINHLAARYYTFVPGRNAPANGRLEVRVRLPAHGARAVLLVVRADGSTLTRTLEQNANGHARRTLRFGRGEIRRIDLVLTNGSTRTTCFVRSPLLPPFYSCYGRPRDDGRVFELRARLVG